MPRPVNCAFPCVHIRLILLKITKKASSFLPYLLDLANISGFVRRLYKENGDRIDCEGDFCHCFALSDWQIGTHDWKHLSMYFKTSVDTGKILLRLRRYDSNANAGSAWWDSLSVTEISNPNMVSTEGLVGYWSFDDDGVCSEEPNLIENASFEDGMTSWTGKCPDGVECSIDDTSATDEQSSFKAVFHGGDNFYQIGQYIDEVEPDTYYRLSYDIKIEDRLARTGVEYALYRAYAQTQKPGPRGQKYEAAAARIA